MLVINDIDVISQAVISKYPRRIVRRDAVPPLPWNVDYRHVAFAEAPHSSPDFGSRTADLDASISYLCAKVSTKENKARQGNNCETEKYVTVQSAPHASPYLPWHFCSQHLLSSIDPQYLLFR